MEYVLSEEEYEALNNSFSVKKHNALKEQAKLLEIYNKLISENMYLEIIYGHNNMFPNMRSIKLRNKEDLIKQKDDVIDDLNETLTNVQKELREIKDKWWYRVFS